MILIEIVSGIEIDGHIGNSVLSAAASDVLTARNAQLPVSWSWSAVPSGVTPTASGGTLTIARTNAAAGSFALTVTAIDARGFRRIRDYAWSVQALPLQVTGTLADAEVGTAYSASLSVLGGVTPYASATVIVGPAWMTAGISGTTITLSGTPTAGAGGTITIRVTDADGVTRDYTATLLWVDLTLTGDYPDAGVGTSYSHDLTIAGGNGIYSNPRVTSGSLAGSGLSLSIVGDKLRLSGTTGATGATYTFTVAVDSGDGQSATSVQQMESKDSYSSRVLASSPMAYWPCDDLSGSVLKDISGNARDGALMDGAFKMDVLRPNANGSLYSNGGFGTAAASINAASWMPSHNSKWTMEAIFAITSGYAVSAQLFSTNHGDYSAYGYPGLLVEPRSSNRMRFRTEASSLEHSRNYLDGVPRHVVGTYDGATGETKLYVNGVLAMTVTSSCRDFGSVWYLLGDASYYYAKGYISDVAFYDKVLSAADILEHAQAGGFA